MGRDIFDQNVIFLKERYFQTNVMIEKNKINVKNLSLFSVPNLGIEVQIFN